MPVRVAINGFGRVGRSVLRSAHERDSGIEVVAINDVADGATLAHLLRYDSVYGPFSGAVKAGDGWLSVDGRRIETSCTGTVEELPWAELDVDVVIESTGRLRSRAEAARASRGRRTQGDHLGARQAARRDRRARRELRRGL